MVRVGLAPCSPFSVSRDLMREAALLARDKGVMLHTHLAENDEDIAYSLAQFGCRPGQYAEDLGWTGADVWHAHCVKLDGPEIDLFARSGTGVAHCPCSNCRLGSGIAPVRAMRDAGVKVGLGVDGSASQRRRQPDRRGAAGDAAAAGGARGRRDERARGAGDRDAGRRAGAGARPIAASLEPGKRADLAIWDVSGIEAAGAWDPVAALVLCGPTRVRDLFVEGRRRGARRADRHHRPAPGDRDPDPPCPPADGLRDGAGGAPPGPPCDGPGQGFTRVRGPCRRPLRR